MNEVKFEKDEALQKIADAQKLIEENKVERTSRVLQGLDRLLKENNCDITVEMLVPFMGQDILITEKMLPSEKVKLTIVAK